MNEPQPDRFLRLIILNFVPSLSKSTKGKGKDFLFLFKEG